MLPCCQVFRILENLTSDLDLEVKFTGILIHLRFLVDTYGFSFQLLHYFHVASLPARQGDSSTASAFYAEG